MINATELRIGNWVNMSLEEYDRHEFATRREFKIKGFNDGTGRDGCKQIFFWEMDSTIGGTVHSGSYDIDCEPILLTNEILRTLGFDGNDKRRFKHTETVLTMYFDNGNFHIQDYDWFELKMPHIQYVHQLQNLYFLLTGEELKQPD